MFWEAEESVQCAEALAEGTRAGWPQRSLWRLIAVDLVQCVDEVLRLYLSRLPRGGHRPSSVLRLGNDKQGVVGVLIDVPRQNKMATAREEDLARAKAEFSLEKNPHY